MPHCILYPFKQVNEYPFQEYDIFRGTSQKRIDWEIFQPSKNQLSFDHVKYYLMWCQIDQNHRPLRSRCKLCYGVEVVQKQQFLYKGSTYPIFSSHLLSKRISSPPTHMVWVRDTTSLWISQAWNAWNLSFYSLLSI